MKKSHGFTLLELIITLALVGVLSIVAGAGFVSATKGYLFTKDVNVNTQNGQATMARLGKMFINLTDITRTGDNAFKVTYKRNDIDITEQISLVKDSGAKTGTLQTTHSGSTNPKIPAGTFALQNHVSNFIVQYHVAGTSGWLNAPPSGDLRNLALIRVQLKMDIEGTPLEFSSNFIPRNVFNAPQNFDPNGLFTDFGSSPNCFVATATYGTPNNPVVLLLRQFRDKYLLTWSGGRDLVSFYYTYGPIAAKYIRGNDTLIKLSKIVLLPIAGFAYLTLLNPLGLLCIPLIFFLGRGAARTYLPELRKSMSGGIMIGIIGAMLFMSLLSVAMLHMYGSTAFATVGYSLSPKAYYLAESGLRHVGKVYTDEITKENGEPSNAVRALHNKTFSLPSKTKADSSSSERIHYNIATYWFEAPSKNKKVNKLVFKKNALGALPPTVSAKNKQGHLYLASSKKLVSYKKTVANETGVVFRLNEDTQIQKREDILFAGLVNKGGGTLSVGDNISIGDAISVFPPAGGIVRIDNGTKEKYAMYARANYAEGSLEGLTEIPGQPKFDNSFTVQPNTTSVVLQYHARITSTGSIGSADEPVIRTITQSQPLLVINSLVRRTFTDTFDNPEQSLGRWQTILGKERAIKNQPDSDGANNNALECSGSTITYNAIHENHESQISVENLTGLNHENQTVKDMLKLHEAWSGNDNLLLYDMQVKIKFNKDDDVTHTTFNGIPIPDPNYTYGTWMHGLAFHIEQKDNNTFTTMYGLSLLNTFRGREYRSGFISESYTDWDAIYDDLQEDHDSNNLSNFWSGYNDTHHWDDYPIYNGVPYLVFWERTFDRQGIIFNYTLFDGARYLSKYPLAKLTRAAFAVYKRVNGDGPKYITHVYYSGDNNGLEQAEDAYNTIYQRKNGYSDVTNYEYDNPEQEWKVRNNTNLTYRKKNDGQLNSITCSNYRPAYKKPYVGFALSPLYNVLNRTTVNSAWVLGTPINETFTTLPSGDLEEKGYVIEAPANFSYRIWEVLGVNFNNIDPESNLLSAKHSYRFWIQNWTTLHATVTEFNAAETDYCDLLGSEKIVVVSAGFATPDGNGNPTGDVKVVGRTAYPRSPEGEPSFQWTDRGDYFKLALWESRKGNQNNEIWQWRYRFKNYSSQIIKRNSPLGNTLNLEHDAKSVFPGLDNENDYTYALAGSFSSPDKIEDPNARPLGNVEVGLHTMGIGDFGDGASEKVYFDDFALRVYQRNPQGLMPGIQQES